MRCPEKDGGLVLARRTRTHTNPEQHEDEFALQRHASALLPVPLWFSGILFEHLSIVFPRT